VSADRNLLLTTTPTTGSKVGIVISVGKKHVRGHIYVDSDAEWPAWQAAIATDPNLSLIFVPMASHLAGSDQFHQDVAAAVGVTLTQMLGDPRCVVVDNASNMVEQVIMADDSIDTLPGKTLVNHQLATVGSTYVPATQTFIIPVIPPGVKV
jgi:hypothetical protein